MYIHVSRAIVPQYIYRHKCVGCVCIQSLHGIRIAKQAQELTSTRVEWPLCDNTALSIPRPRGWHTNPTPSQSTSYPPPNPTLFRYSLFYPTTPSLPDLFHPQLLQTGANFTLGILYCTVMSEFLWFYLLLLINCLSHSLTFLFRSNSIPFPQPFFDISVDIPFNEINKYLLMLNKSLRFH